MIKTISFKGDPFDVFKKFYGRRGLFFLDSSQAGIDGKFSYIGFEPYYTSRVDQIQTLRTEFKKHKRRQSISTKGLSCGGAVGYLGYDNHFYFGFYDQILTFNHQNLTITIHGANQHVIDSILESIIGVKTYVPMIKQSPSSLTFRSNFSKKSYIQAVKKSLVHIQRGDIYQINLSRIIHCDVKHVDPVAIYGSLRGHSPSPYAAYFDDGQQIILSSSPERFLRLLGSKVQVKPMKGTRRRALSKSEDVRLKKELIASPKEIAELLMVTDLERNDLGRVCNYGSVKVASRRAIEEYRNVFQATATIEGTLNSKFDAFDLLQATFPSGSVTGCPKIAAMKIIKKLEGANRGLYTGALGYIAFDGSMDFSVLIRTLFVKKNQIAFHVGGGIVADSNPLAEYEETVLKAEAMQKALIDSVGSR